MRSSPSSPTKLTYAPASCWRSARRRPRRPGLVDRSLVGVPVDRGHVDHDPALPVRERGGIHRNPRHRSAEHAQLGGAQHRRRVLEGGRGSSSASVVVDRVHEHRARCCARPVAGILGRVDARVRHRLDHVGERRRERAEGRDGAFALVERAGVDEHREHHELAVPLRRQERQRRRGHHVGDRRELLRRRFGRGDEALRRSRPSRAGRACRR